MQRYAVFLLQACALASCALALGGKYGLVSGGGECAKTLSLPGGRSMAHSDTSKNGQKCSGNGKIIVEEWISFGSKLQQKQQHRAVPDAQKRQLQMEYVESIGTIDARGWDNQAFSCGGVNSRGIYTFVGDATTSFAKTYMAKGGISVKPKPGVTYLHIGQAGGNIDEYSYVLQPGGCWYAHGYVPPSSSNGGKKPKKVTKEPVEETPEEEEDMSEEPSEKPEPSSGKKGKKKKGVTEDDEDEEGASDTPEGEDEDDDTVGKKAESTAESEDETEAEDTTEPESSNPMPSDESDPTGDASAENKATGDGSCFPADATVELEDGTVVTMDKLRIGDRVRVSGGAFSTVFMFTHKDTAEDAAYRYVSVSTASGVSLTLTPGHYLQRADGALFAASALRANVDSLLLADGTEDLVVAVSETVAVGRGLYNPQTMEGTIVVNGVVASTYTTAVHPEVAHILLAPFRAAYGKLGLLTTAFEKGADSLAAIAPSGTAVVNSA